MKPLHHQPAKPAPTEPSRRVLVVPVPHPFHFGFKERRPLVPMAAVKTLLNRSSREITALIEEGRLRWAFDIRSCKASQHETRVLWQSLLEFSGLYPHPSATNRSEEAEFEAVIQLILPSGTTRSPDKEGPEADLQKPTPAPAALPQPVIARQPVLRVIQVADAFSCLSPHVLNLLREQSLQEFNVQQGPKASRLVTRASVIKFLKERRIS